MKGLGLSLDDEQRLSESGTAPEVAYKLARDTYKAGCDGVFSSCTFFRTVEILERFEKDMGKPMVSSNQASMWLALRTLGVKKPIKGFGSLMTRL